MYAIKESGDLRAVSEGMALDPDETAYLDIPQWVYDKFQAAEESVISIAAENVWRDQEVDAIANQLMALEEQEATGEDTGALPGTRLQWLSYRTKVRAWKDANDRFPNSAHRPSRPV